MDATDRALQVLIDAEGKLAAILRDSVEARAYEDLAGVAAISTQLAGIIRSVDGAHGPPTVASGRPSVPGTDRDVALRNPLEMGSSRARRRQPTGYPKFARDGDRLVKIGWSKKDGVEYEHRAPQSALRGVVSALRATGDREFAMDDVFPLKDHGGDEIPSYQAYLVLAWLRSIGAVQKASRGGYVCQHQRLSEAEIEAEWKAMSSEAVGEDSA
jgi:hypothetical protein